MTLRTFESALLAKSAKVYRGFSSGHWQLNSKQNTNNVKKKLKKVTDIRDEKKHEGLTASLQSVVYFELHTAEYVCSVMFTLKVF